LDFFIEKYKRTFSLENLLEIILKINHLGNNLEEMKIIKFNEIEEFDNLYFERKKERDASPVSKFQYIRDTSKNPLHDLNN